MSYKEASFVLVWNFNTHVPPSKKLQTLSSRLETRWNVSRMICCWTSSPYSMQHKRHRQWTNISF